MSILLDQLTKRYSGLLVVDHVSLDVASGELFVLLGTSGSGKSTILRLIAGLAQPDGGRITLDGRDVTTLSPQQRGTGFVFQNYSIFRHMSVAENIEFGLKIRKMPSAERAERRDQLLDLVGLAGMDNRHADQLSGGQQQRVALARALAYQPTVLLLDEPFGALDAKTRTQLRRSLKEVQKQLGVTTILVTHDQDEAFELADRIGVLEHGRLLEVGGAETLYTSPKTLFGATFLGAGTVLVGQVHEEQAHFGPLVLPIPPEVPHEDGSPVQVLFRPEQVSLSVEKPTDQMAVLGRGAISEQYFTGALRRVQIRLPRLPATRQIAPPVPFGEEDMTVDAVIPSEMPVITRDLWVSLRGWHILEQPDLRLLIVDAGTGSTATLALARQMMEQGEASATLLAVTDDQNGVEPLRARLLQRRQEAGLVRADVRVRIGDAATQIAMEQHEALYALVMLAPQASHASISRGGRPERRWLRQRNRLGPVAMRVLEQSTVPVLVVKKERPTLARVLICTATGEPGKNDVRIGGRLARRLGASVTLLYVAGESAEPGRLVRAHLQRAASTLRALDVPVNVQITHARTPAKGILAESRTGDHDLIVVGSHGRHARSFLGRDNVTLQVLVGADRPVLVVPSEEEWFGDDSALRRLWSRHPEGAD